MDTLSSSAEVQDIPNVTAQSLARLCGLIDDPSIQDAQSEAQRRIGLSRQVRLLFHQQSQVIYLFR